MCKNLILISLITIGFYGCIFKKKEDKQPDPFEIHIDSFPPPVLPENNPTTVQGIHLGRILFYDSILSENKSQSCASCHIQQFAFSNGEKQFSEGNNGTQTSYNTSTLVNIAWNSNYSWNGRYTSLEKQIKDHVTAPNILNISWDTAIERFEDHQKYSRKFKDAFGPEKISDSLIVNALAQFVRSIISSNSKFDQARRGEAQYNSSESNGFEMFILEKGDCWHCHVLPRFKHDQLRNNGLDSIIDGTGAGAITGNPKDNGKWNPPTLRNIEYSAPYMHDGRFNTLKEVLDHYVSGWHASATLDPLLLARRNSALPPLNEEEKQDIISFLKCLSDSSFINNEDYGYLGI